MSVKCNFCHNEFSHQGIRRHITACKARKDDSAVRSHIYLKVDDPYSFEYVIYLGVDPSVTLKELDIFIRTIWLECCGHLSHFRINGTYYSEENGNVNVLLSALVNKGDSMTYEYDFGSTSTLEISHLGDIEFNNASGRLITVVARNTIENDPYNSPRTGVCGYDGPYYEQISNEAYGERITPEHHANEDMIGRINDELMNYSGDPTGILNQIKSYMADMLQTIDPEILEDESMTIDEATTQMNEMIDGYKSTMLDHIDTIRHFGYNRYYFNDRTELYLNPDTDLDKILIQFSKDILTCIARATHLSGFSKLKKDDLRKALVDHLPQWFESSLSLVDDRQMKVLKDIVKNGGYVREDADLYETFFDLGSTFEMMTNMVFVGENLKNSDETIAVIPKEIRDVLKKPLSKDVRKKQRRNRRWNDITRGLIRLNGMVDSSVLISFVRSKAKDDFDRMEL